MKIRQKMSFLRACSLGIIFWALFGEPPRGFAHPEASEAPSVVNRLLGARRVIAIVQDKYGFLWFGADNGLFRWDGAQMEEFYHRNGDPRSLPSNAVLHLHEDRRGVLWVGTVNGLARFHRQNGHFTTFLEGKSIADIHEERGGALWCWAHTADASADEIYRFNPENGETMAFSQGKGGLKSAYLYAFLEDASGFVWLGTANGLHRFNRQSKRFTALMTDAATLGSPARAPESHILSLLEDEQAGTLLVGTGRGIFTLQALQNNGSFQSASAVNGLPPLIAASAIPLLFRSVGGEIAVFAMQPSSRQSGSNGANKGAFARLSGAVGGKGSP